MLKQQCGRHATYRRSYRYYVIANKTNRKLSAATFRLHDKIKQFQDSSICHIILTKIKENNYFCSNIISRHTLLSCRRSPLIISNVCNGYITDKRMQCYFTYLINKAILLFGIYVWLPVDVSKLQTSKSTVNRKAAVGVCFHLPFLSLS